MSEHKILQNEFISSGVYTVTVEKNGIEFTPGACASIQGKVYSIASTPDADTLQFFIRRIEGGAASDTICKLPIGSNLKIESVFQYFFPSRDCKHHDFSFISTGTGLSPLYSALRWYKAKPYTILAGARNMSDISFLDPAHLRDVVNYKLVASQEEPHQRVTEFLHLLPVTPTHKYFICGLDVMIDEVSNYLFDNGVSYNQISTEQFFYSR